VSNQVRSVVNALTNFSEDIIKQLTIETTAEVVKATPIDTGWARANWIPSVGDPVDATTGSKDGVTTSRQEAGVAEVLTTYTLRRGNLFITNNVPYITKLNEGTSTQAPSGFVQQSIARAIKRVITKRIQTGTADKVI
jgi:hypothetical protein